MDDFTSSLLESHEIAEIDHWITREQNLTEEKLRNMAHNKYVRN